jgi:HAD domain in Swiss Army Knife RNA repair proteins
MKLIFLDIDGVLNSEAYRDEYGPSALDPYLVRNLLSICVFTGCSIIISSDWRHDGIGTIVDALECRHVEPLRFEEIYNISQRIIGKTEDLGNRSVEITEHIYRLGNSVESWCAIDDLDLDLPAPNFVKTDPKRGLDWERTMTVIEKLNGLGHVS